MPASGSPARYLRQASKKVLRTWSRVGSNILRLSLEFAQVADHALGTGRLAREAHVAPVQDQPVVRMLHELRRHELEELEFHFERILARRDARAIRHPENVSVHGHRRLAEGDIEHHIRRLAPDAGQALKLFPGCWNLSFMFFLKQS